MVQRSLHHVPWEHGITWCHVLREYDAALTKPGNIVYLYTSRDARWTNHDWVIEIVMITLEYMDLLWTFCCKIQCRTTQLAVYGNTLLWQLRYACKQYMSVTAMFLTTTQWSWLRSEDSLEIVTNVIHKRWWVLSVWVWWCLSVPEKNHSVNSVTVWYGFEQSFTIVDFLTFNKVV